MTSRFAHRGARPASPRTLLTTLVAASLVSFVAAGGGESSGEDDCGEQAIWILTAGQEKRCCTSFLNNDVDKFEYTAEPTTSGSWGPGSIEFWVEEFDHSEDLTNPEQVEASKCKLDSSTMACTGSACIPPSFSGKCDAVVDISAKGHEDICLVAKCTGATCDDHKVEIKFHHTPPAFDHGAALKAAVVNCLGNVTSGENCCSTDPNCADPSSARCGAYGCDDMPNWNTSLVTDMSRLFADCDGANWWCGGVVFDSSSFNEDISGWNTSQVTTMEDMFNGATSFNQAIGAWDTSQVTNMYRMFWGATAFYQDITGWSDASLTTSTEMFAGATAFFNSYKRLDGTTSTDGPPSAWASSSPNEKDDAKEKKEKAEKTRDTMLNGVTDAKLKKKAKLLADAAISGKKVKKMSAKLTAPDEDTACSDYYTKAGLSSSLGACIATAASRRRSLAATTYDVSVFFSEAEVDDSTLTAAENSLKAEGVTGVETSDPIDPITELGTIDGVDSSTLETFKTEVTAAAAMMPPSPPPPPMSPPPPNLVLDEDDHAAGLGGTLLAVVTTALLVL